MDGNRGPSRRRIQCPNACRCGRGSQHCFPNPQALKSSCRVASDGPCYWRVCPSRCAMPSNRISKLITAVYKVNRQDKTSPRTERVVMSVSSETRHGRMAKPSLMRANSPLFVQVLETDEDGALVPMNILRGSPVTCVTLPQPSSYFSSAVVGRTRPPQVFSMLICEPSRRIVSLLYISTGHVKLLPGPVCHMNERMQSSFGTWKPW